MPTLRPFKTAKADDDVGCERALDVQKLAVVHDSLDDIEHVIGARGLLRNDRAEGLVDPLRVVALVGDRGVVQVVEREVAEEEPDGLHALFLGIQREVRHAGELRMRVRAAELLVRDLSSPVTALMTSGPVMNICEMPRTMSVKSVMAGE